MKFMLRIYTRLVLFIFIVLFPCGESAVAQLLINEISPSNVSIIQNYNGDYDDWLEIYNAGSTSIDLAGYSLTDNSADTLLFQFPHYILPAGSTVLVFASDTTKEVVNHYEMSVDGLSSWKYTLGSSTLDTNWRNLSYNDGSWSTGNGGFGFSDDDDETILPPSVSIMVRKTFDVPDKTNVVDAIFRMDYDDAFVAYLNGVEIARANLPVHPGRPLWNELAPEPHEAQMFAGRLPDSFIVSNDILNTILVEGNNVLAVEVHDRAAVPTDQSCIPFLFFGMKNSTMTFAALPQWFIVPPQEHFNAKFKLAKSGESVYLFDPSGTLIDHITYPQVESDNSYARIPDGASNFCFIYSPTPEMPNSGTCYAGYAPAPVVSLAAGFYDTIQTVTLSTSFPSSVIHYSLNGDIPTIASPVYTSPILIDSTVTLRARVFSLGYIPGETVSNTYFINENPHLSVFSIATDSSNLWDYNTGIYVLGPNADTVSPFYGANFWQPWSKPASIEYFDKSKTKLFSFNADIEIYGNYSRKYPQKSFEIKMSDHNGAGEINYPLIPDKPYLNRFERIILRNSGTDCNKVHFRDGLMHRIMKKTNCSYVGVEPAVLYLNGAFWGVYLITEKNNHKWIERNYGLKKSEFNYLDEVGSQMEVGAGSDNSFWDLYNYITMASPYAEGYLKQVNTMLDVKNFADYFIAETFYNNGDWIGDWTNNIKLWQPKKRNGRWRYILHDLDFGLGLSGSVSENRLVMARYPTASSFSSDMFNAMLENEEFRQYFINRYCDLINTIYLRDSVESVMKQFRDSMIYDMPAHFEKWGSDTIDWLDRIDAMMLFVKRRPKIVIEDIEHEFNLIEEVDLTIDVSPPGAGRIEISTVVPMSYPWTGTYFHGNPVTVTAIPNPGYSFDHWLSDNTIAFTDTNQSTTYDFALDDVITAYFTGAPAPVEVSVSELNYHSSPDYDAGDWIELHNYSNIDLNLSGWKLKDEQGYHEYQFPTNTKIPSGGYLVIAAEIEEFRKLYPDVSNLIGGFDFNFGNNGELIRIYDYQDNLYSSFYFQTASPWPSSPDGEGYTCERNGNTNDPNDGMNWFAGCFGGSPGKPFSPLLSTLIKVTIDKPLCDGAETELSTLFVNNFIYQWVVDNTDISGSNSSSLTITESGTYSVEVNAQSCYGASDPISIVRKPIATPPNVKPSQRCGSGTLLLSATSDEEINWYDSPNGNLLSTGEAFLTPTLEQSKLYYVRSGGECPSDAIAITAEVLEEPCENTMLVFPNPAENSTITIESQELITGSAVLSVTDMSGHVVRQILVYIDSSSRSHTFDLSEIGAGMYILSLKQDELKIYSRFVRL